MSDQPNEPPRQPVKQVLEKQAIEKIVKTENELRIFASRSRRKNLVGRTREVRTSLTGYGDFTPSTPWRER